MNTILPSDEHTDELRDWIDAVRVETPPEADYHHALRRTRLALDERTRKKQDARGWLNHPAPIARWSVSACIMVAAAALFLNAVGPEPGHVYAAVARQLREAVTVAFHAQLYFQGTPDPTEVEMAFREPGLQRTVMTYGGAEVIQINDTHTDKGLVLIPADQTFLALDLTTMPDAEQERLGLLRMVTEELKTLDTDADEVLPDREVDGRTLRGFRVETKTLWIDVETETLAQVDLPMGGSRMVLSNFRIDPEDLNASHFSTDPPAEYDPAVEGPISGDVTEVGEQDVVEFLQFMAASRIDGRFPDAINPMEILTLEDRGLLRVDTFTDPAEQQEAGRRFAVASQRAMTFVMRMKPVHNWHYRGAGIEMGSGDRAIAWWNPVPETHRVIWGDLRITDETDWESTD